MDSDLSAKLESILSDPKQMQQLTQMAQGLMGQLGASPDQTPAGEETPPAASVSDALSAITSSDTKLLSTLGKAFSGGREKSRSTELLTAMRPYMKPEKQEKLDRAMKVARMVHIAGAVMKEYGGGDHGV